jgi:hypothetical protein
MQEALVNFETRFKQRLSLEDEDPVPEDWKRSEFKESVTSEYGDKMAGYKDHQGFADVLRAMGFIRSQAKADIENNNLYEYIAIYVDDLLIAATKGAGPLTKHLGCDYFRDQDGTLCFDPRNTSQR